MSKCADPQSPREVLEAKPSAHRTPSLAVSRLLSKPLSPAFQMGGPPPPRSDASPAEDFLPLGSTLSNICRLPSVWTRPPGPQTIQPPPI